MKNIIFDFLTAEDGLDDETMEMAVLLVRHKSVVYRDL
jgi:hypothetical protein